MKTIATFRPSDRMAETQAYAQECGLRVINLPTLVIEPRPPEALLPLLDVARKRGLDWLAFLSETSVDLYVRSLRTLGVSGEEAPHRNAKVAAIGNATGTALKRAGIRVDLLPDRFDSHGLLTSLTAQGVLRGKTIVLLRSSAGSPVLRRGLLASGAKLIELPLYDFRLPQESEEQRAFFSPSNLDRIDAFVLTSSLGALNLRKLALRNRAWMRLKRAMSKGTVVALGTPTLSTLRKMGVKASVLSRESTLESIVELLASGDVDAFEN